MKFDIQGSIDFNFEQSGALQQIIMEAVYDKILRDQERIERVCLQSLYFGVGVLIIRDDVGGLIDVQLNPDVPYMQIYEYDPRIGVAVEDD